MSFERVQLRKLLMFAGISQKERITRYKDDIKQKMRRAEASVNGEGIKNSGGFYGLFWKDAKGSVLHGLDLVEATEARIAEDSRKKNIFPKLLVGFQAWWRNKRRWTNEPFSEGDHLAQRYSVPGSSCTIYIENILSVSDSEGVVRHVYPYWYNEPELSVSIAKMGLQALVNAFPSVDPESFRILDIIRGETYSLDKVGSEKEDFLLLMELHERFCLEYESVRGEID